MNLAEVRESEAPPQVAAVYAALREASGVPLVNLIWRHLATLDGALDWAWATVAPALRGGFVAGARDRLAAGLVLPQVPAVSPQAWAAAGLDEAALRAVRGVVAVYNRGNLSNLVMLTALRRQLEGLPAAAGVPVSAPVGPVLAPVPPLLKLDEMTPAVATLVQALGARHEAAATGIIPSLWLHLAHWPALLAALPGWLGPMLEAPVLREARLGAMALAVQEGDAVRARFAEVGEPPRRAEMLAALTTFTTLLIPDMCPIGVALDRTLPK